MGLSDEEGSIASQCGGQHSLASRCWGGRFGVGVLM